MNHQLQPQTSTPTSHEITDLKTDEPSIQTLSDTLHPTSQESFNPTSQQASNQKPEEPSIISEEPLSSTSYQTPSITYLDQIIPPTSIEEPHEYTNDNNDGDHNNNIDDKDKDNNHDNNNEGKDNGYHHDDDNDNDVDSKISEFSWKEMANESVSESIDASFECDISAIESIFRFNASISETYAKSFVVNVI